MSGVSSGLIGRPILLSAGSLGGGTLQPLGLLYLHPIGIETPKGGLLGGRDASHGGIIQLIGLTDVAICLFLVPSTQSEQRLSFFELQVELGGHGRHVILVLSRLPSPIGCSR